MVSCFILKQDMPRGMFAAWTYIRRVHYLMVYLSTLVVLMQVSFGKNCT